jgi:hypothetical protein
MQLASTLITVTGQQPHPTTLSDSSEPLTPQGDRGDGKRAANILVLRIPDLKASGV